MNKEEKLKIFKQQSYEYAHRFIYCVCADTPESWLHKMSGFKYWRLLDELEFKHNISIKESNREYFQIYEDIFVNVLSNRIEECKIERRDKQKQERKKKKEKEDKGIKD